MELWDDLKRLVRRRPKPDVTGGKFGDEYWFPARPNPWPFVAIGVAIVMAVWAVVVWTDDGSSSTALPPASTDQPTLLNGSNGLTSRDLSGCLAFKASSSEGASILAQALAPEGEDLAATGALTEDIINGYVDGFDAVVDSFDDPKLTTLVTELRAKFVEEREAARAQELEGTDPWAALYTEVRQQLRAFGVAFESRCEKGGIIVTVVPKG